MAVRFEQVTATAVDAATQDFTVSGLGASSSIVAVLWWWSKWNGTGDGAEPDGCLGWGSSDFTNDGCVFTANEDGATNDEGHRKCTNDKSVDIRHVVSGTPTKLGSGDASAITNGVRLSWSDQMGGDAGDWKITAIIFADDAGTKKLKIVCGEFQTTGIASTGDTYNVTTTGVDPDVVFIGGSYSGQSGVASSMSTSGGFSFGCAVDDGNSPMTQDGYRYGSENGAASGGPFCSMPVLNINRWVLNNQWKNAGSNQMQVSAMGTAQFTLKAVIDSTPGNNGGWFMAIELGADISAALNSDALPGATGDDTLSFTGLTAAPQFMIGMHSIYDTRGAHSINYEAGSFGIYATDGTNEVTHGMTNEDGAATIQSVSWFAERLSQPWDDAGDTDTDVTGGADGWEGDFDSFNAASPSTAIINYPTNISTSTGHAWWVAFEEDAVPATASAVTAVLGRQRTHQTHLRM